VKRRLLAVVLLAGSLASPATGAEPPRLVRDARAPVVRARAVDGRAVDLQAALERGPVLVDFWATWCRPCLASLPSVQALHERWRERGLTVIGVSIDGPRNFARVRPFAQRLGLGYPIVIDEDGSLQQRFRVSAVPTSVLIEPGGRIARVHTGWAPGEDAALEAEVERLLSPAAADSVR
jgi:peroxiredoxin